jgi:TetR/AcrR family transcriptional repressor of nem operon
LSLHKTPKGLDKSKTTGHIMGMARRNVREQLLSAGLETLHRRGFNATSVQDITEAAGVPKGSFYNHFESKEALGAEAVIKYREASDAWTATRALRDTKAAPLTRLRKYFEGLADRALKTESWSGCLLANFACELSNQSPLIREQVAVAFAEWSDEIAVVIGEAQRVGALSKDLPSKALAEFLINAWEGALLRARVDKDRAPLQLFLKVTFSKILS